MVIATWCQREETPETPFSEAEKKELQFLYDEWAHPYFISIEEYERLMQASTVIKLCFPVPILSFTGWSIRSVLQIILDVRSDWVNSQAKGGCPGDEQGTGRLDSVATADWTEPTIPSWRHSIWVGVYDPWRVIRTLSPRIWIKVGTGNQILMPERAESLLGHSISPRTVST